MGIHGTEADPGLPYPPHSFKSAGEQTALAKEQVFGKVFEKAADGDVSGRQKDPEGAAQLSAFRTH